MKVIQSVQTVNIPSNVTVDFNGRKVKVTGPLGTLEHHFKHILLEFERISKKKLQVKIWFGNKKHLECMRTVCSQILNMIKGVTKGFQYKMRSAYAHFPINLSIVDNKKSLEIRNFIGEKIVRRVPMLSTVTVDVTDQKDEITVRGIDLQAVSQSAANIQQIARVKDKDVRKFLDGIYVFERTTIEKAQN